MFCINNLQRISFYIGFLDLQLIIGIILKLFYFISYLQIVSFFASYVILLSAAHDILTEQESSTSKGISTTVPR